jgi:hypothetical protein
MVTEKVKYLDTMEPTKPKSAVLMGCILFDTVKTITKTVIVSPVVAENIAVRFMRDLWDTMIDQSRTYRMFFLGLLGYTRALMTKPDQLVNLVGHDLVGKNDPRFHTSTPVNFSSLGAVAGFVWCMISWLPLELSRTLCFTQ